MEFSSHNYLYFRHSDIYPNTYTANYSTISSAKSYLFGVIIANGAFGLLQLVDFTHDFFLLPQFEVVRVNLRLQSLHGVIHLLLGAVLELIAQLRDRLTL